MLPSLLLPSDAVDTDVLVLPLGARSEGTAAALELIAEELRDSAREAATAAGVQQIEPNASLEPWLPAQLKQVLGILRANGIPVDLTPNASSMQVADDALFLFEALLEEHGLRLLAEEKAVDVRVTRDVDAETVEVRRVRASDGTLLAAVASVLEDQDVVHYEFETQLPNAKYRQFHADPERSLDPNAHRESFWHVITFDMFNRVAVDRRTRGFEAHLLRQFPHPFVLTVARDISLTDFRAQARESRHFVILNEQAAGFDPARLNARVNTSSQWPRLRPELLAPEFAHTLLGCVRTRLVHYNAVLAFHGTLRNSAESIDSGIDFGASRAGSALGTGLYLTTNPNEALAYSLARLRTKRREQSGAAGPSIGAGGGSTHTLTDDDVVTILVFFVRDAHLITRGDRNGTGRTFVINTRPQFGNQFVLHAGCRQYLRLVQVHDIDARGRIFHTKITDSAHAGEELRGVDSATA